MPPKRAREQFTIPPEILAKRTKRHLDELEKSNYTEPTLLVPTVEDEEEAGYSKGRGRQTISDKRKLNIPGTSPAATGKKSTMAVRTAVLYRKNFATLLEESVRWSPNFTKIFTEGRHKAEHLVNAINQRQLPQCVCTKSIVSSSSSVFGVRVLGSIPLSSMFDAVLRPEL
ncbi:hypothetical protein CC1G_06439 [Coprinopsis cinerea okayama7|uniref:Uncharacterized protein n=1 Tax=Coprinopsis cinerea (strain Okayama-7 / 130 / ATCC MYA-4618 / FGSC 9003) TaxID=240176 RepID=A8NU11_COPC7|nr:hypothetical protein CC1G_06439 [Coprinopsis cinerea okayama7\|eukprot:XP_001836354.2 hypothetical protein CC1G_06439 [Coprinopsis cinerea okayama7\